MKKIQLLLIALISTISISNAVDLSFNLVKGTTYKQKMAIKMNITQEFGGMKIDMVMGIDGALNMNVKDVTDKGYLIETKYESLKMSMNGGGLNMEFNSNSTDAEDKFSTMLKGMVNQPFEMLMSKKGKVLEIKNLDKLFEGVLKNSNIPESQKEQLKVQLENAYGENAFKNNFEMSMNIYPDKSVNKGDKWESTTSVKTNFSGDIKTTYELVDIQNDYYIVKGTSTITTADTNATVEMNGMQTKQNLNGSQISDLKIDKKTGWVVESTITQDIEGSVSIKLSPDAPETKVPMKIKSEIKITN